MSRGSPVIFNLLTVVVLLAACGVGACYAYVALNPASVPQPLQELPLPTVLPTPLPSPTALIDTFPTPITPTTVASATQAPASATPTAEGSATEGPSPTVTRTGTFTLTPTITITPSPTRTLTPAPTNTAAGPSATPSATLSNLPFTMQAGSPTYQPNFANTAGCNWMGIAGQAFDLSGRSIIGLIVRVTFKDGTIDAITGSNKSYGEGGYEVFLNDHAEATTGAYSIRLLNASSSVLSDTYTINTFADCNRNLIIVNFVQNH